MVADLLFLHQALLQRREVVGGGPLLGDVLLAEVDLSGLERLQRHGGVAEIFGPHGVEVAQPLAGRLIPCPPIGHPLIGHRAAELELTHAVRSGTQRGLGQWLGEIPPFPPMLRQYRHLAQDQRQFAVAVGREVEHHAQRPLDRDVGDVGIILPVERPALLPQGVEGPGDILGRNRLAVVEAGFGAQFEGHRSAVRRQLDHRGEMAIGRAVLVGRGAQQGVVNARDIGGAATDDEGIEAIEGADRRHHDVAALRRIRVHVGEIGKVRRQRGRAEHGKSMRAPDRRIGRSGRPGR